MKYLVGWNIPTLATLRSSTCYVRSTTEQYLPSFSANSILSKIVWIPIYAAQCASISDAFSYKHNIHQCVSDVPIIKII